MKRTGFLLFVTALALSAAFSCPAAAADGDPAPEVQLVYRPPAVELGAAPRNTERAFLEFTAVLLYENIRYWVTYSDWVEDWQYELTWEDQKRRLLELDGVRFDSNNFATNWTHAYAGGIYYSLGRVNNLGVKDSFLLALFESVYWECIVEWREVISVNDTAMTVFGALSIGEPWYQLAHYLTTRRSQVVRALGFIHPLVGLHSLLDPGSRPRATPTQTLPGFGVALSLGATNTEARYSSDSGTFTTVALRSRLALAPGFTAPGTESRQGWEVFSSSFDVAADLDAGEVRELDVSSGAVFYGRLDRSVREDSRGSATILGFGSAFTLFRKAPVTDYDAGEVEVLPETDLRLREPRNFRDKYAIVHLFGPVYEGYWRGATLGVSWGLEAYPDFAQVNAYALNAYSAGHDISGTKTTLRYYGYYYGYGASIKARVAAAAGPVTLGAVAAITYHESIEGLDRYEDQLSGDVHASDTWYRFDVNLGVPVPRTPLAVELSARWSSRRGAIGDTVVRGAESRYSLGLTWRL
jgi:hypothetical protein